MTLRVTKANRRWQVAGFSLLAFLAAVEAYSRIYLLKHWITDVFGGLIFGAGLLIIATIAFSILDGPGKRQPVGPERAAREVDTGDRSVDMRDPQSAWRSSPS